MTQSSYLMSFIHGLLENSSKEVRERKRRLLERDYTETEEVLNVYLNEKYNEVTQILNVYRDVSENLGNNRKAVQKMKRDIGQCKSLLSFNRDELRRLWLELVEQRRSLELIEVLDQVRVAPEVLKNLIVAQAWPEATEYLLKTTEIMIKEVEHVPALDTVKSELASKKKMLIDEMRSTLFFLVFNQPIALLINEKNNGSGAGTQCSSAFSRDFADHLSEFYPYERRSQSADSVAAFTDLPLSDWRSLSFDPPEIDSALFKDPQVVAGNLLAKRLGSSGGSGGSFVSSKDAKNRITHNLYGEPNHTQESMNRMITDKRQWAENIVALTHCLHRLQKLSQAFYSWRLKAPSTDATYDISGTSTSKPARTNNEIFSPGRGLIAEIHNSITVPAIAEIERTLATQGETSPASSLADPTYLVELLRLLFPAFCMHFNAFLLVLSTTRKIKEKDPTVSFQFLDVLSEEHIWGYIQMEVQTILSAHLSSHKLSVDSSLFPTDNRAAASNFNASKLDLNILMGKRRGAFPTFFGVTSDSSAQHLGLTDSSSISKNGDSFFSFSKTAHSLSLNSYLRENRINMPFEISAFAPIAESNSASGQMDVISSYPVVCRPSADNIRSVYSLVLTFASLIEMQSVSLQVAVQHPLGSDREITEVVANTNSEYRISSVSPLRAGKAITQGLRGAIFAIGGQKALPKSFKARCQLRLFLLNFIERLYLPNAEVRLRQPLVLAVSNQDALTAIISQQTQRELGLQCPILSVAYLTNQILGETKGMAIALPDYASNCAKIGLSILETFLTWASSVYKNISASGTNGTVIPSAEWARDKDLSRFWTNFPVWQRMMAADAFATAGAAYTVTNLHDSQLRREVNSSNLTVFSSQHHSPSSTSGSNLSSAAAIVLGLNVHTDPSFTGGSSLQVIPFVNSIGQDNSMEEDKTDSNGSSSVASVPRNRISRKDDILLHERETTRLAVKEMDNLLHIIHDEVGSSSDSCLPTAGMLTIKNIGRLRESVHWLERCVQDWLEWLQRHVSYLDMAPFVAAAEELTSLSDATLLTVYLDVRVQAYNLFGNLPRTANFWCPVDEVDVDPEVTRCLVYWDQLQVVLVHSFCPHEMRFIFDGLGDFISQIFLRLIPQITRMNVNGNRKMCRNIYKLQQSLALLTENHESDLIRVKQLYELFYLTPEAVVNRVIEQGVAFEVGVYQNLLKLYQRSHPSHDHSRTDDSITKLAQIIRT